MQHTFNDLFWHLTVFFSQFWQLFIFTSLALCWEKFSRYGFKKLFSCCTDAQPCCSNVKHPSNHTQYNTVHRGYSTGVVVHPCGTFIYNTTHCDDNIVNYAMLTNPLGNQNYSQKLELSLACLVPRAGPQ